MESRDGFTVMLGTIVLTLGLYVGCYFLAVRPGVAVWFAPTGTKMVLLPDYRGLPARLFEPMHYVDRTFIRPNVWGPGRIWTVRGQNGLNLKGGRTTNIYWNMPTNSVALSNAPW